MVRMPNASTCLEGIRFDLYMCIVHVPVSIVILRTIKLLCVVRAFLTVTHRYGIAAGSKQSASSMYMFTHRDCIRNVCRFLC